MSSPLSASRQLALFPADREVPACADGYGVKVRLNAMELHRPRQWGACWLACHLYEKLELDRFWSARLPNSRQGTQWRHILQTLVCYRLIDPGSEWATDALALARFAVLGISGGAATSIAYAVRHLHRVSKLVLLGAMRRAAISATRPEAPSKHRYFS